MLELQRILQEYRDNGRDASGIPVFDDASFRLGMYNDGSVLKFRGIIRDVYDPELVLLNDAADGDAPMNTTTLSEQLGDKFVERVPLKVALVPHVNDWAVERYSAKATVAASGLSMEASAGKGTKRSNEQITDNDMEDTVVVDGSEVAKKVRATTSDETQEPPGSAITFTESVVTIYVYDGQYSGVKMDAFKVNESFEFTGVLDMMVMASGGAVSYDDGFTAQSIAELTISDCLEGIQRKQQSSVVLHCCDALLLDAVHFVQPHKPHSEYTKLTANATRLAMLATEWRTLRHGDTVDVASIRIYLLDHLTRAIGGDELAAEYTLLCLLSRVYSRPDTSTALGNFSVNLSFAKSATSPVMEDTIQHVTSTLTAIVPMLATVDMSIKSLNEVQFLPHKDYDSDTLQGGKLQFAQGTTVIVNETLLSAGNLNDQGVKNVGALQSLVAKMLLPYDFQYYSMDFPQDVAVLSFSQGKSILPVHVSVPVRLVAAAAAARAATHETATTDDGPLFECFRLYLAVLRALEVRLSNEQAELAEKHYVACRKAKQEVSIDDLHRWLRLARLVALSKGEEGATSDAWQHMLSLEDQRIARMDEQSDS